MKISKKLVSFMLALVMVVTPSVGPFDILEYL